jgi:hypothetical protein
MCVTVQDVSYNDVGLELKPISPKRCNIKESYIMRRKQIPLLIKEMDLLLVQLRNF